MTQDSHSPAATTNGEENHPAKKLSKEEIERSTQRLHTTTRRELPLKPLHESAKLSKEDEEKSVKRLYDDAIALQKRKHEESTKKQNDHEPQGKKVVLTVSEEQEAVSRLYEKSVQQKQMMHETLEKRHAPPKDEKRLDSTQQADVNKRLYNDSQSKQQEGRSKLYEKYVVEVQPKAAKMNKEQLAESAKRLTSGGK